MAVYDDIAAHFSKTRAYPWPEVESFLDDVSGEVGLDVGCGNGRHAAVLAERVERVLAVDVSRELLFEARDVLCEGGRHGGLLQADAARVPLAAGTVDVGLYVATVHHLPTRERRVESLAELKRVLVDEGRALVSAWSTTHDNFEREAGFDTTVDWTLPGGETVPRFYHIYAPEEFEADLQTAGLDVESSYISSGNCYAEIKGKHP